MSAESETAVTANKDHPFHPLTATPIHTQGLREGHGVHMEQFGDEYRGDFKNGQYHGYFFGGGGFPPIFLGASFVCICAILGGWITFSVFFNFLLLFFEFVAGAGGMCDYRRLDSLLRKSSGPREMAFGVLVIRPK